MTFSNTTNHTEIANWMPMRHWVETLGLRDDEYDSEGLERLCYVIAKEPMFSRTGGYARAWLGSTQVALYSGELVRRVLSVLSQVPVSSRELLVAARHFRIVPVIIECALDTWSFDRKQSNQTSTSNLSKRQQRLANSFFWALAEEFGYPVVDDIDESFCNSTLVLALIDLARRLDPATRALKKSHHHRLIHQSPRG